MWGAFGNEPLDVAPRACSGAGAARAAPPPRDLEGPGPQQWGIVHAVRISNDGLVYVADRGNSRVQVFTLDGKYQTQVFVNRKDKSAATACGLALSADPQQKYLYVSDFGNGHVWILDRKSLDRSRSLRRAGARAGQLPERAPHDHRFEGEPLHGRSQSRQPRAAVRLQRHETAVGHGLAVAGENAHRPGYNPSHGVDRSSEARAHPRVHAPIGRRGPGRRADHGRVLSLHGAEVRLRPEHLRGVGVLRVRRARACSRRATTAGRTTSSRRPARRPGRSRFSAGCWRPSTCWPPSRAAASTST